MKKLLKCCFLITAFITNNLTGQNLGQVGCSNIFGVPTNNILSQVTINGVVNSSTSLAANENFTGISIPAVNAGSNLTISATGTTDAYNNIAIFAYLDFNNDGFYDYSSGSVEMKKLYSLSAAGLYNSGNQTFNIPASAPSGTYRLRIIAFAQASASTLNPCNSVTGGVKGQAEDYQITVIGQPCTAPTFTYSAPTGCSNNEYYINVNVTSLGNASSVQIKNGSTALTTVSSTGTHQVGPFASGSTVNLNVVSENNASCAATVQQVTYTCPCTAPTFTHNVVPDCNTNQYSIEVDVTSLGNANSVAIKNGTSTVTTVTNTGTVTIGPFTSGTTVNLSAADQNNSACSTTTQQVVYNCPCTAPTANYNIITDCNSNQYSIEVDLTNLGTAASVAIKVGSSTLRTVSATGTYIVGPFASGTTQNIFVADANNANCAATSQAMSYTCPACTPATATYTVVDDCANDEFSIDVNVSNLGTATSLDITDGTNTLQTVTATGTVTVGPFTNGTNVTLTIVDAANANCSTTSAVLTTGCPACTPATATYTVVDDCANDEFSIDVNVSNLGTATSLDITDGTNTLQTVTATGTVTVGPFTNGTNVTLTIVDAANANCSTTSAVLTTGCPACTPATATYTVVDDCANDEFSIDVNVSNLGTATSLDITDGTNTLQTVNATGTVTVGPFTNGTQVTLTLVDANNPYCSATSTALVTGCPACTTAAAIYTVVNDCANDEFSVEVNITSLGTATSLDITDGTNTLQTVTTTGSVTVGPFINGTQVTLTLVDAANANCSTTSAALTANCVSCVIPSATFATLEDCDNGQFSVVINLTDMGNNTSISVESLTITSTGTYTVGPFAATDTITLTLQGNTSSNCILQSGLLAVDCSGDTIGINDPKVQLTIFPNPTSDIVTISSKAEGFVQLLDVTGKLLQIYKVHTGENPISVGNFPNGVYIIRMHTSEGIQHARIVVSH